MQTGWKEKNLSAENDFKLAFWCQFRKRSLKLKIRIKEHKQALKIDLL